MIGQRWGEKSRIKEDSIVFRLEMDVVVQHLMKPIGALLTDYREVTGKVPDCFAEKCHPFSCISPSFKLLDLREGSRSAGRRGRRKEGEIKKGRKRRETEKTHTVMTSSLCHKTERSICRSHFCSISTGRNRLGSWGRRLTCLPDGPWVWWLEGSTPPQGLRCNNALLNLFVTQCAR